MRAIQTAVLVGMFAGALAAVPAAGAPAAPRETLRAVVGPNFNISLRHAADDSPVRNLLPGEYAIVVEDRGIEHNFHLTGPGVDQATDVDKLETVTWTLTVTDGKYDYVCDAHAGLMKGSFTVGNVPPPPPPPPPPIRLMGSVTPKAIAVRTATGARAKIVIAGRYKLTVRDTAKNQNFHLTGPGVNRKTAVRSRATATWSLALKAGAYRYRSDASKLRGSFRVTP